MDRDKLWKLIDSYALHTLLNQPIGPVAKKIEDFLDESGV